MYYKFKNILLLLQNKRSVDSSYHEVHGYCQLNKHCLRTSLKSISMRKLFFVLALIATCAFNGFAQKTVVKKFQDTQARMLDINATGYVKPLAVELKVLEVGRINQSWPLTKEQAEVEMEGDMINIRSWALFMTCEKYSADVIVAPTFNFKTTDDGTGYIITVVGFPANFVNWRTINETDYEWIRMERTQTTGDRENIKALIK